MRVLVVGAGAVGGYFGAKLAEAGRDVTFLLRKVRAEQVRADGLRVTEGDGEFTVRPAVVTAAELKEPFDVVLLSTKAYQMGQAMEDFAPAVGERTVIVPLLNGMRHLDVLRERFGEEHVMGGWSKISSDLEADGTVRVFVGYSPNLIEFGELEGGVSERATAVHAALSGAGFPVEVSKDIVAGMWSKWYLLASLAATTCLLRGSVGEIESVRWGAQTAVAINAECAAIAAANGYPQAAEFCAAHDARMSKEGSALTASMFRDVRKGAQVEVEHTLGDFLLRGERKGVETPLLKAAYVQLSVYERQRMGAAK